MSWEPTADIASPRASGEGTERIVVWPQCSLDSRGMIIVLAFTAAVFAAIDLGMVPVSAWPIFVYIVLALCGFAMAMTSNLRAARFAQVIEFAPEAIRVCCIGPASRDRNTAAFNPYSVRIVEEPGYCNEKRLILREGGRSLPIGDFLPPDERALLAAELRERVAEHNHARE